MSTLSLLRKLVLLWATTIVYCENDDIVKLIRKNGYTPEVHELTTDDGYILSLHRIKPNDDVPVKAVAILVHGFLCSGADFMSLGKNISLAFYLADNGVDVWLPNARGTRYSKKHKYLKTDEKQYWNFTLAEIAEYDMPTIVDHILKESNTKKIHYIGFSQGTTVYFMFMSLHPRYSENIVTMHGMAPVVFMHNIPSPIFQFLAKHIGMVREIFLINELYDISSATGPMQAFGKILCRPNTATQGLCLTATLTVVGENDDNFDIDYLPKIVEYFPSGASWKQFIHYGQMINAGKLQMYDYEEWNKIIYRKPKPPEFKINVNDVPIHLYYGSNDLFVSVKDTMELKKQLKSAQFHHIKGYNHISFLFATDVKSKVYTPILNSINEYSTM